MLIDLHRLHPDIPEPYHRAMAKETNMSLGIVEPWVLFVIGCAILRGFLDVSIHDHLSIEDDFDF